MQSRFRSRHDTLFTDLSPEKKTAVQLKKKSRIWTSPLETVHDISDLLENSNNIDWTGANHDLNHHVLVIVLKALPLGASSGSR